MGAHPSGGWWHLDFCIPPPPDLDLEAIKYPDKVATDEELMTDPIDTDGKPYSWFMWSKESRQRWIELHGMKETDNG